uniref:Uncharacterized protein n=1 Tax=Nomascus leucogenys TaxID=61853 RepID=A0A2I3I005_NOMLE
IYQRCNYSGLHKTNQFFSLESLSWRDDFARNIVKGPSTVCLVALPSQECGLSCVVQNGVLPAMFALRPKDTTCVSVAQPKSYMHRVAHTLLARALVQGRLGIVAQPSVQIKTRDSMSTEPE